MTSLNKSTKSNSAQNTSTENTSLENRPTQVQSDSWVSLKSLTDARIALGRSGVSIPTGAQLQFNLDHALARDAVNIALNMQDLQAELALLTPTLILHSRATERREYLQRPDLGRRLNPDSVLTLQSHALQQTRSPDVALMLVDGLSSTGVQKQGGALSIAIKTACESLGLQVSPLCLVQQGRVAIGDEIGELLHARTTVLIVGERPGLSSPDSLGIYYTYAPKLGLNDASRNCISNIRPGGLSIVKATDKILWLIQESMKLQFSGVNLKDTADPEQSSEALAGDTFEKNRNFLLSENPPGAGKQKSKKLNRQKGS